MNKQTKKEELKLCTLSGTTEVGRNCNFLEYKDEILIIDAGFSFPGQEMYGIDYLIPNFKYLRQNKSKVKGIAITHGHLDHTGALRYLLPDLNFPPIYAGSFAKALINEKLKEHGMDKRTRINAVKRSTTINIGKYFRVTFIGVNHSIPDAYSIFVETPNGNVFFSGDYKLDVNPANEKETDYAKLKSLRGKIDLALMESTNSQTPGKAPSETEIAENLEDVIRKSNGRVIVASFSSLLTRLYSLIEIAKKTKRKVVISGRSLEQSVSIAQDQRYLDIPKGLIIKEHEIKRYPANEILVLCTGSQAERYAALNRISLNEHKYIKLKDGDLVVLSSSEIPENITKIEQMTDRLIALGADLMKDTAENKIHSTGHGYREDMKMMFEMIKPKSVMPIHGPLTFRYFNKQNFLRWGMPDSRIFLTDDGQMWRYNGTYWRRGKKIESKPILIDGLGVGDTGDIVLNDRQQLAEFGIFSVVLNLSSKNKKIIGSPRFISRGFIYMKKSHELLKELENIVRNTHKEWVQKSQKKNKYIIKDLQRMIESRLSGYIFKKTEREPIILVVTI
jgi:ribonuclease J